MCFKKAHLLSREAPESPSYRNRLEVWGRSQRRQGVSTGDNEGVGWVGRVYRAHRNPSSMLYHRKVDSDECVTCVWVRVKRIRVFIPSPGTTASSLRMYALGCSAYLQGTYL